jgi:polysaccharide biosynthesis/export protein
MTKEAVMRLGRILLGCALIIAALGPGRASAKEYVIGAADVISIAVMDNRDLDTVTSVAPNGKVSVPLVGDVQAAGLTVAELTDRLTQAFAKKVKAPQVTVSLREINSYRIYFLGRVGRPGVMMSKSEVTLLQALSMAGGIQEGADLSLAYVARGTERLPIDFLKLVRDGDLSQNVLLSPDDTVVIPDNPLNVVYVMGEVKSPGMLPFMKERDWTALKAVAAVGGFNQFAARGKATLLRGRNTVPVDFNNLMRNPEAGKDIPLLPGDILIVPQSLF